MKRQLLVAQLAALLEERAAEHRLRGQAMAAGLLDGVPAQLRRDQAQQLAVLVQPRRHRLGLTADLVSGERIHYTVRTGLASTDNVVQNLALADRDREVYVEMMRAKKTLTILRDPAAAAAQMTLNPIIAKLFEGLRGKPHSIAASVREYASHG
jgi:hypothetical protein